MGRPAKFDYQSAIESSLIANPDGLTLDQLLERSGFEVDRSTLFRHLAKLIEQGRAERLGKARASRYRSPSLVRIATDPAPHGGRHPELGPAPEFIEQPLPRAASFRPPQGAIHPAHQTVRAEPDRVSAGPLGYGEAVKKAVRKVVREWKRFSRVNLEIYLSLLVKPEHLNQVVEAVEYALTGLNEGNLADFGLTPAEFAGFTPPPGREARTE
jgi:hypothetical protein